MRAVGWYEDPRNKDMVRWWDGEKWTEHTRLPESADPDAEKPEHGGEHQGLGSDARPAANGYGLGEIKTIHKVLLAFLGGVFAAVGLYLAEDMIAVVITIVLAVTVATLPLILAAVAKGDERKRAEQRRAAYTKNGTTLKRREPRWVRIADSVVLYTAGTVGVGCFILYETGEIGRESLTGAYVLYMLSMSLYFVLRNTVMALSRAVAARGKTENEQGH